MGAIEHSEEPVVEGEGKKPEPEHDCDSEKSE